MSVRSRLGVIGTAVAVIVAAGLWYSWPAPGATSPAAATSKQSVLSGSFVATYDFMTPMLGWSLVVDYSSLRTRAWMFKTVDGGLNWDREYIAPALGARIYLHFFDPLHGFAFTGYAFRTVDGGVHWLRIDVPGTRPYVTFSSPLYGWAEVFGSGRPRLFRTVDAGKTWTLIGTAPLGAAVLQPTATYETTTFRADCEGWLGAKGTGRPTVFLTTDCGRTWQLVELHLGGPVDPDLAYVTSVRLVGASTVAVFNGSPSDQLVGATLTSDSGATWDPFSQPIPLDASGEVSFVDPSNWWVFNEGVVYTTNSGGYSWQHVEAFGIPSGWNFQDAQGIDGTHAWSSLVSISHPERQSLAMTADAGAHWTLVGTPLP